MILRNDDDLAAVNNEYMGPPGSNWPRARFIAYGIFAGLALALLAFERKLGISPSIMQGVWTASIAIAITVQVGKLITFERPFRTLLVGVWHQVRGPRPMRWHRAATLHPARIPVGPALSY